ncbi:MAG: hypothetical protein KAY50_09300 [Chitinophagaceae bacterium]|nr:hypothetical protein [Chitinophagaceae bacterium]
MFPDEFPIVVKEKNKLVVIEGNRRLAALKALDNPERVPFFKDRIKSLKHPKIQKIRAVLAPSREKALQLIANKHTNNLRRPWQPLRQAYFYKSQIENGKTIEQLKTDYPGHNITKFIKMLEAHHLAKSIIYENDAVTLMVHDERKFPITNLERMYDDPYVTDYLGFGFETNGKVKGKVKSDDFKKPYRKIVEDISLNQLNSRNTNTKEQRQKYIDSMPPELKPNKGNKGSFTTSSFKETKVDKVELGKKVKSIKKQKGLIPSYIPFKLEHSSLREIYEELRHIPVKDFANATHDLLRSFLECTLVCYLKETEEYKFVEKNSKHNPKLDEMLTFILSDKCTSIDDNSLKQVIEHIKSHYTQAYSLVRLNMINHNETWVSTEKEVRTAWSKIEPLMKYLLNPKKDARNS